MKTEVNPETTRSFFIKTEETYYKNEHRVKLIMRYDTATSNAVKSIPGARWNEDMHCWHIPYTPDYLSVIKSCINHNNVCIKSLERPLNKTHDEPQKELFSLKKLSDRTPAQPQKELINVKINCEEGLIYITMPYIKDIILQIKKMDGAWWHTGAKVWSVFFTTENLEKIKELFNKKEYALLIKETSHLPHATIFQRTTLFNSSLKIKVNEQ